MVRTIQKHWPGTGITWIIGKLEASLVGDIEGVEFIVFDKSRRFRALAALRRALAGRSFDVLLNLQVALRASSVSLFVKASVRLGYDRERARDAQRFFTTHRVEAVERHGPFQGTVLVVCRLARCHPWGGQGWDPVPRTVNDMARPQRETPCST